MRARQLRRLATRVSRRLRSGRLLFSLYVGGGVGVLIFASTYFIDPVCRSLEALLPSITLRPYPDEPTMLSAIGRQLVDANIPASVVFDCSQHRRPEGIYSYPLGFFGLGFALLTLVLLAGASWVSRMVSAHLLQRDADEAWVRATLTAVAVLVTGVAYVLSDAQELGTFVWFAEYALLFGFLDLAVSSSIPPSQLAKLPDKSRTVGLEWEEKILVFESVLATAVFASLGVSAVAGFAASAHVSIRGLDLVMHGSILAYGFLGLAGLYFFALRRMRSLAAVA